jgi:hypothetical protein
LREDDNGFVSVDDLLNLPDFRGVDRERMCRIAETSVGTRGNRFELRGGEAEAPLEVRALYRHPPDSGRRPRRGGFFSGGSGGGYNGSSSRAGGFNVGGNGRELPSQDGEGNQFRDIRGGVMQTRGGFSRPPPQEDPYADEHEDGEIDFKAQWGDGRRLRAAVKDGAAAASEVSATNNGAATKRGDASNTSNTSSTTASGASTGGDANDEGSEARASSSSGAAANTAEATWERYNEPESDRVWFWNKATEEVFWADDPDSGWEQYFGAQGQPWWYNEAEGRFFHEEE